MVAKLAPIVAVANVARAVREHGFLIAMQNAFAALGKLAGVAQQAGARRRRLAGIPVAPPTLPAGGHGFV